MKRIRNITGEIITRPVQRHTCQRITCSSSSSYKLYTDRIIYTVVYTCSLYNVMDVGYRKNISLYLFC